MLLKTDQIISITDANQNFSKVARLVDEQKSVVIMKNNRPKYIIIEFQEFAKGTLVEDERIEEIADRILKENMEAFKELAE